MTKKNAPKISYFIPLSARAVNSTNWLAAHPFNTQETEIYGLNSFYS